VATLNIAHGRKDGRNQMLLREQTIRNNLVEVAGLMERSEADVIALQEVDAESKWSGKFNHLDLLSANSAYACTYHGLHASGWLYDFGTALLARRPFHDSFGHSFQPSWPYYDQGFFLCRARLESRWRVAGAHWGEFCFRAPRFFAPLGAPLTN
jgi:endonuclease/exonuclease/phosphatase family metal-dependent hydrolase